MAKCLNGFYKFNSFSNISLSLIRKKYLQSDWLRGVQYWPQEKKNTTFEYRSGKIEIYLLKIN